MTLCMTLGTEMEQVYLRTLGPAWSSHNTVFKAVLSKVLHICIKYTDT